MEKMVNKFDFEIWKKWIEIWKNLAVPTEGNEKKLKYATKNLKIFIFEIWNENFHLKFGISLE
jgi:hypothetical protein